MNQLIRCQGPNCFRTFLPDRNKMYCSPACRMSASRTKRAAIDIELSRLDVYYGKGAGQPGNPADLAHQSLKMAIVQGCPEGSASYRLGTFPQITKGPPLLRWFPTYATSQLGVFSIEPFENPHVPFQGYYVVAYFDSSQVLICTPDRRVAVEIPMRLIPWHQGDEVMEIRRSKQR